MKPKFTLRSFLLSASSSLVAVSSIQAAPYSWSDAVNGTAVSANWSTGTNWTAVPVGAADTTLSFGMTFGSNSTAETNTLTNDVANPFQLNILTFTAAPTAANGSNNAIVNIDGSPLSLVLNGATTPLVNLNANRSNGQLVTYNVQSNVALDAGTVFTGNGTATFNFSGQLSGSAFTKSGTSTLTLSGANTFTGNTTLSAGGLVLGNNSALNSGDLIVTGDSRISILNGVTIANTIDRGTSTVTYALPSATAATATFSGPLTGTGTINIANSGSGNNTTILDFTNAGGFTGNVVGAAGNAVGADYFRFASIGDGGNFTFQKAGNRGGVIFNGTSAITFGTRQIAIGTAFGGGGTYGLNGNGIPQNAFQNNATDPTHTVTFNSNMSVGAIASSSIFYFDGSNTGNNTFAGTIGDALGGTGDSNTLGIGKWGAGKWILTGSNSYEGNTFITNGTLSVNAIDVASNNQPLGKGSLIAFGYNATAGTLEFTGSSNSSTDKQINVGNNNNNHAGGAAILNNGTGTLSFTNGTFNVLPGGVTTVDRTLTLGGNNTGANEIQGVIQDNVLSAAQTLLAKSGTGTWTLSGANTYTGTTTAGGGVLKLNNATALPGGTGATGGTSNLTINGGGVVGLTAASGDFLRARGTTAAQVQWTGSGGFAAYGGDRTVRLNNDSATAAQWNNGSFVPGGQSLILSAADSDGTLIFDNPINFAGSQRTIQVNNGSAAIDARITRAMSGGTSSGLNKTGAGTLEITSASSSYSGATTVANGTLRLGASGVLPDTTNVTIAAAVLDVPAGVVESTGTGTLDVTAAATINLGDGSSKLVFADSSAVDWTDTPGTLNITGIFVSGSSIRFGDGTGTGLTPTQLGFITVNGSGPVGIDINGFLTTGAGPSGYAAWQATNGTAGTRDQDHDNDGVDNGTEHFLGGDTNTTGFTPLPGVVNTGGILSVTWVRHPNYSSATFPGNYGTDFVVETSATLIGPWTPETPVGTNVVITGNNVTYTFPGGPGYTGKNFARLRVTGP